jgi:hypothetical protein
MYAVASSTNIVMLSEAKHLHGIAMPCAEMLHFVQHDMGFMADCVSPVIMIYAATTGDHHTHDDHE